MHCRNWRPRGRCPRYWIWRYKTWCFLARLQSCFGGIFPCYALILIPTLLPYIGRMFLALFTPKEGGGAQEKMGGCPGTWLFLRGSDDWRRGRAPKQCHLPQRKKGSVRPHSSEEGRSPWHWKPLGCDLTGKEGEEYWGLSYLSPVFSLYLVQDAIPWIGATHNQDRSSLNLTSLETAS